jgi:hypothetical protein
MWPPATTASNEKKYPNKLTLYICAGREEPALTRNDGEDSVGVFIQLPERCRALNEESATEGIE